MVAESKSKKYIVPNKETNVEYSLVGVSRKANEKRANSEENSRSRSS